MVKQFAVGTLLLVIAMATSAKAGMYTWYEYNGHWYTATQDYGTWGECEAEAVAVGGHLATVNDAAENSWLSATFSGYYGEGNTTDPSNSLIWIGLYQVTPTLQPYNPLNPNDWHWVSGEPVNPDLSFPIWTNRWRGSWPSDWGPDGYPGGTNHAYLHPDSHPDAGTWWNAPSHDFSAENPKGIIELSQSPVPEPASLILWSGLGTMGLIAARRKRKAG